MDAEKIRYAVDIHRVLDRLEEGCSVQEYHQINVSGTAILLLEEELAEVIAEWVEQRIKRSKLV